MKRKQLLILVLCLCFCATALTGCHKTDDLSNAPATSDPSNGSSSVVQATNIDGTTPAPLPDDSSEPVVSDAATDAPVVTATPNADGSTAKPGVTAAPATNKPGATATPVGAKDNPLVVVLANDDVVTAEMLSKYKAAAKTASATYYVTLQGVFTLTNLEVYTDGTLSFSVSMPDASAATPNLTTAAGGAGTQADPLLYTFAVDHPVPAAFLSELSAQAAKAKQPLYVTLQAEMFVVNLYFSADGTLSFQVTFVQEAYMPTDDWDDENIVIVDWDDLFGTPNP